MKIMRIVEKSGKNKKVETRDMGLEEYNTEDIQLYDVSRDIYDENPALVDTLRKVYAHYNPGLILKGADELPGFNFDIRVQALPHFDTNYTYQEMEDFKQIDTRYIISRFCPPKFKQLVDIYLKKVPIFGLVVPFEHHEAYSELQSAFDKEFHSFLFGEGAFLDEEERFQYKRFLLKQISCDDYLDNREIPFINEAEDNFMLGMINFPGTDDHEYRCFYRPYFREYDVNKELWTKAQDKWIIRFGKAIWFWNYKRNPRNFSQSVSYTLVDRIKRYFISREFNYAFDLPGSFVSRTNLLFIHVWVICERLRVLGYELNMSLKNYSITQKLFNSEIRKECKETKQQLKLIAYLNEKLLKLCEVQTEKALYLLKIHPAQRNKIKVICEKQAQSVTYLLFKHFELENKGYKDLDVLMQSIFFPQKQPLKEFPEFIFLISEYIMKHREYFSHLSLEDIKNANIDWDVMRIDKKVVNLMKQARKGEEVQTYPENTLDENDMAVIQMLESILPEEKRRVVEEKGKSNPLKEKYKPINKL